MPSQFDALMSNVMVPTVERYFAVPAIYLPQSVAESCNVILDKALSAVGQYGERMEYQNTLTVVKSLGAGIGDVFEVSDVNWELTQLIKDDGFFMTFAAISDE